MVPFRTVDGVFEHGAHTLQVSETVGLWTQAKLDPILHPAVHQFSWTSLIRYWVSHMSEHQTL